MSYVPEQPHIYQGKQVIINSDRLLFNAKTDSILLFSDKAIGFSTNGSFHFDTGGLDGNKFVVNAPDIYLGLDADKYPTEPALLGDKTEDYLSGSSADKQKEIHDDVLGAKKEILRELVEGRERVEELVTVNSLTTLHFDKRLLGIEGYLLSLDRPELDQDSNEQRSRFEMFKKQNEGIDKLR